jgi:uncharacterized protein (TIGR02145 family)
MVTGCVAGTGTARVLFADIIQAKKDGYLPYRLTVRTADTSGMRIVMLPSAGTVQDADGNVYETLRLGGQVWMAENLGTTQYNDSTPIPSVSGKNAWSDCTAGAYCSYGNTNANRTKHGALYNWYAVGTGKLAPRGWRIPTDAEWDTLITYLRVNGYGVKDTASGSHVAKAMAEKAEWEASVASGSVGYDLSGNNECGFSARPSGRRNPLGDFIYKGYSGFWWSATAHDSSDAWYRSLYYGNSFVYRLTTGKEEGLSVRCVRDTAGEPVIDALR